MNNLYIAFEETYEDVILADIAEEEHRFSPEFERKMKKLLRNSCRIKMTARQVIKYAIIAALLAVLAIGAAAVMYWNHLRMEQHDIFSLLYIDSIVDAPKTIESVYDVTEDMSGFIQTVEEENRFMHCVQYTDDEKDKKVIFTQMTVDSVQGIRLNTEDAEDTITTMLINGYDAIYFETASGIENVIWDNSEYVFAIEARGVGKDALIKIANSVKKAEYKK